ncbi:MAG: class I SAM-dependent methyltransferase [Armatimonadetes bacterium]|nr:class I SAM-dependent methyltransferase [Armatimonadota bacterium]
MDFKQYFESAKKLGPNPFYKELDPHLGDPGKVLELGFGVGTGVLWWLDKGWEVTAVDQGSEFCEHLRCEIGENAKCEIMEGDYCMGFNDQYDVVSAVFSIFFVTGDRFYEVFNQSLECVKPGGLWAGQLLGPDDDWRDDVTTLTYPEIKELVPDWKILQWNEVNRAGKTVFNEPKHWHVHHLILQKPE